MSQGHLFPKSVYDAISFLTRSALHVLPDPAPFRQWLDTVSRRLVQAYPLLPEDPFTHLFNRSAPATLGRLIGREVLDPAIAFAPDRDIGFLSQTLHDAKIARNPFLATEADLKETGFEGTPYVVQP